MASADDRRGETRSHTGPRHSSIFRPPTSITAVVLALGTLLMFGLQGSAVAQEGTPTARREGDSAADRPEVYAYPGTGHTKDGQSAWEAPYKGSGWGNAKAGDGGSGEGVGDGESADGESGGEE